MTRSKLKNSDNKERTKQKWDNYKKQRNFCVNLFRKTKRKFFRDLNINKISWKTIKQFFSNKGLNSNKLLLVEKGNLVSNEKILEMHLIISL